MSLGNDVTRCIMRNMLYGRSHNVWLSYRQRPGSGPGWGFRFRITPFLHESRYFKVPMHYMGSWLFNTKYSEFSRFCNTTYEYFAWEISIPSVDWEVVHVRRPWEVVHSECIKIVSTGSFWLYISCLFHDYVVKYLRRMILLQKVQKARTA